MKGDNSHEPAIEPRKKPSARRILRWENIFEALNDGVCLLDAQGRVEWSNSALGRKLDKVKVKGPFLHFFPEAEANLFETQRTGERTSFHFNRGNGRWRVTLDPIREKGNVTGVICMVADLEEETPGREREDMQQSVQSMESFCYTIAHDLKAPLRAMRSFTAILEEEHGKSLSPEGRELARRIVGSADRMNRLLDDLLAFGRIAEMELGFRNCEMNGLVKSILRDLKEVIESKKAAIQVSEALPAVWANPTMLEQIMTNLITNALKFVEPGKIPRLEIFAEEKGSSARLWVKDYGIGVPPESVSNIFSPFKRLHSTALYPGSGLGLAIVSRGVERMAGRAGVESEPGKGSSFWIELPRMSPPEC